MPRHPKRPRDMNELAVRVGKIATHEIEDVETNVNRAASIGGVARAANLSARRRKAIAQKAARARWRRGKKK
jgi:hypothetical protein